MLGILPDASKTEWSFYINLKFWHTNKDVVNCPLNNSRFHRSYNQWPEAFLILFKDSFTRGGGKFEPTALELPLNAANIFNRLGFKGCNFFTCICGFRYTGVSTYCRPRFSKRIERTYPFYWCLLHHLS